MYYHHARRIEEETPAPNFKLRRCMYYELANAGGRPALAEIFWWEHQNAFASIKSFAFEGEPTALGGDGSCRFLFNGPSVASPTERVAAMLNMKEEERLASSLARCGRALK